MTISTPSNQFVTIVMYHFVRPLGSSRFPRLAALDVSAFREQLEYVRRHYSPIWLSDLMAAADGLTTLPSSPIVLTFDDGYSDHYRHVFPQLAERRLPATFFPVRSALVDRVVLDVNKVQFVLAAANGVHSIVQEIERAIESSRDPTVRSIADYRAAWWVASTFDEPEIVYVKRMLQHALPESIRRPLLDDLFRRFVTEDEAAFAADLYFTTEHAREMHAAGMEFGGHADRHIPLPSLPRAAQAKEIDGALRALDAIGVSRQRFAYSYAKGEYNADSVDLLRERGCGLAVTNRAGLARPVRDELLTLPRIDTNYFPADRQAT